MPALGRIAALLVATALPLAAQTPPPVTDAASPFHRLELPAANTIRTGSGKPGRDYWQQRADYVIRATLDTTAKVLRGEEEITYTNRSPDTLTYVWLQMDQDLFRRDSRGALVFDQGTRFGTAGADGGFTLTRLQVRPLPARGRATAPRRDAATTRVGTMMRVDLPRPLPPGGRLEITAAWSFPFGPNGNRMGLEHVDGHDIYEVAQWYPRMAVYDDVRGWNTEQYYGQGEFYLEYGAFDVRLTLPADLLVGATGTLVNPAQVLTPAQAARLRRARASATTVVIRGADEVADPASRPHPAGGMLTWHFTADSVRDFAWAAARHFIWDAVGADGGRVLAQSLYPPSADSIWRRSSEYVKHALEFYGGKWMRYPYPTMTNINGIEGGMEYPMIVFCHNRVSPTALFSVTDHEVGHSWFPMIVGSNERRHPWMDEGFNTFQNYYSWTDFYGAPPVHRGTPEGIATYQRQGGEQPVTTAPDRTRALGVVAYQKPGVGLRILRDVVLGPDRFDGALREYTRRWAFRHPTPADFFRTVEDYAGEDLSWFWHGWFETTGTLDQAVDSVTTVAANGRQRVYLRNAGALVMPVPLRLDYADGTSDRVTLPVEVWFYGPSYFYVVDGGKPLAGVTIDPDSLLPDVARGNNSWRR
ncbi:MAG TPA: M1 family metallopeptidase [Gemmatimonadales bacterium]|nr:M1 family metallopeptidase [Gemmatimonadales bacterium]